MGDINLGIRLKQAREHAKLRQADVCANLNIPKTQTLSAYERGVNEPRLETLKGMAKLYCVSTDWLLFGEDTQCTKPKTNADAVSELIDAANVLGLQIDMRTDWNGNPTGEYYLSLSNVNLSGLDELFSDIYKLNEVKSILDDEDYQTLVRKRISSSAKKTNDYERTEPSASNAASLLNYDNYDGTDLPF